MGCRPSRRFITPWQPRRLLWKSWTKTASSRSRFIKNDAPDFVDTVVETTNNQNPMDPRNLKSHTREQRILQTLFKEYTPRWFYQLKEGQWNSLTEEDARFFKPVVGYSVKEFRPD